MRDPFREGLAAGWNHIDASTLAADQMLEADVVIVGSGAGGVTAELLSEAGLKVIIVEEGPLRTSSDFKMLESEAYPALYQESASRLTADKAIKILQGRCRRFDYRQLDQQLPYAAAHPALVADGARSQESVGRGHGTLVRGNGAAPACWPMAPTAE